MYSASFEASECASKQSKFATRSPVSFLEHRQTSITSFFLSLVLFSLKKKGASVFFAPPFPPLLASENAAHARDPRRPRSLRRLDEHDERGSSGDDDRCGRRIDFFLSIIFLLFALLRRGRQGDHGHRGPRGRPSGPLHAQGQARARDVSLGRGRSARSCALSQGPGRAVRGAVRTSFLFVFFWRADEGDRGDSACGKWGAEKGGG